MSTKSRERREKAHAYKSGEQGKETNKPTAVAAEAASVNPAIAPQHTPKAD